MAASFEHCMKCLRVVREVRKDKEAEIDALEERCLDAVHASTTSSAVGDVVHAMVRDLRAIVGSVTYDLAAALVTAAGLARLEEDAAKALVHGTAPSPAKKPPIVHAVVTKRCLRVMHELVVHVRNACRLVSRQTDTHTAVDAMMERLCFDLDGADDLEKAQQSLKGFRDSLTLLHHPADFKTALLRALGYAPSLTNPQSA